MKFGFGSSLKILASAAYLFLASCADHGRLILNPDGSGKMLITQTMDVGNDFPKEQRDSFLAFGKEKMGPIMIKQMGSAVEGIETLADLNFSEKDGKFTMSFVAYFPDINKLALSDGSSVTLVRINETTFLLTEAFGEDPNDEGDQPVNILEVDEEIVKSTAEENSKILLEAATMLSELPKYVATTEWIVPGVIIESEDPRVKGNTFTKTKDQDAVKRLIKIYQDKEIMQLVARKSISGKTGFLRTLNSDTEVAAMVERKFGKDPEDKPVKILFHVGKPQFDYKAEVEEAKRNPGEMLLKARNNKAEDFDLNTLLQQFQNK